MIDTTAQQQIRDWQSAQKLTIGLRQTDHSEQKTFTAFAQAFSLCSKGILWQNSQEEADLPGFVLRDNIIYSAIPLKRELVPFLRGLDSLGAPEAVSPKIRQMLDRIHLPCTLTLYIALQCPHCPAMVETLIPLAAYCPQLRLHIIDGSLFPDRASEDRVMAAPCLILDGDFRWTGAVDPEEIIAMILNRDPAALSTGTLKNILEAGDADWITREMMAANTLFEGFMGLLLHETWSVRLGAMVVVESLAQEAPNLGRQLVPRLLDAYPEQEIPVQGDILYALGEIGDGDTADWIRQTVGDDTHEDLKDAALDALESIEDRRAG